MPASYGKFFMNKEYDYAFMTVRTLFPSYQCVYLPVVLISSLFRWSARMLMPAPVHDVTGPAKACREHLVLLAQVRPSFAPQQPVAIFDGRMDLRSSCVSTGTNCVNTEVLMT